MKALTILKILTTSTLLSTLAVSNVQALSVPPKCEVTGTCKPCLINPFYCKDKNNPFGKGDSEQNKTDILINRPEQGNLALVEEQPNNCSLKNKVQLCHVILKTQR